MGAQGLNVLLVEDNPGDAALIADHLQVGCDGPIQLRPVAYLADALQALIPGSFDTVLLDLNLPDSDGLDTVRQVLAVLLHDLGQRRS